MSLLDDAVDELYAVDLDQFTARRKQLAAEAKAAGDPEAAKTIAALRKPTQAAFTVNRLARTDPDAIQQLIDLGAELQRAQRGADAAALRELNRQRRATLNELVERAFEVIGQQSPSAGQREEVNATLQAALADPGLAEQLRGGAVVKAAEASGFGFTAPELTVVRSAPAGRRTTSAAAEPESGGEPDRTPPAEPSTKAGPTARERAAAAAASRREAARRQAQQEVDDADAAVNAAVAAIDAGQQLIRLLQRQLAEAKRQLDEQQKAAKAAEARQRKAREALNKAGRG